MSEVTQLNWKHTTYQYKSVHEANGYQIIEMYRVLNESYGTLEDAKQACETHMLRHLIGKLTGEPA